MLKSCQSLGIAMRSQKCSIGGVWARALEIAMKLQSSGGDTSSLLPTSGARLLLVYPGEWGSQMKLWQPVQILTHMSVLHMEATVTCQQVSLCAKSEKMWSSARRHASCIDERLN